MELEIKLTLDGKVFESSDVNLLNMTQICDWLGIKNGAYRARVHRGDSPSEALSALLPKPLTVTEHIENFLQNR